MNKLSTLTGKKIELNDNKFHKTHRHKSLKISHSKISNTSFIPAHEPVDHIFDSRNIGNLILSIVLASALFGCSSGYPVTYDSSPQSAMLICGNSQQGYTPKTLYYQLTDENKRSRILRTTPCKAIWVSGKQVEYSNVIDLNKLPRGAHTTVTNPNITSQDIQFDQQRRQAEATNAAIQQVNSSNTVYQPRNASCYQIGALTNCYTY